MNSFRVGERVALKSCTDSPGTVTGFGRGKVEVLFDDFSNDAPKAFRPDSLQFFRNPMSVPKSDGSGTRICSLANAKNQSFAEQLAATFLGQGPRGD